MVPLSWGIDVFGLGEARELILVARQAAEEDPTADAEDGGPPAEAVGPGVVVAALEDQVIEPDWVDDEGDELNDHCGEKQAEQRFVSGGSFRNREGHQWWIIPNRGGGWLCGTVTQVGESTKTSVRACELKSLGFRCNNKLEHVSFRLEGG